jgi:ABC-2 type transport system permease protein
VTNTIQARRAHSPTYRPTLRWFLHDSWLMAGRNARRIWRAPDLIFTMAVAPTVFFVFFRYVLGGAILIPGWDYTQFLIPGTLVGTSMFVSVPAISVAIAQDLRNGIMDRFRALPMVRIAVPVGHAMSESVRYASSIVIQLVIGLIAGFRFYGGLDRGAAAIVLLLLWGLALAWVGAVFGLLARSVEAAQMMATMLLAPFGFISSVYVPTQSMPLVLRVIAERNPVTPTSDAVRALFNGTSPGPAIWESLASIAAITVIFGIIATIRLRRIVA